MSSRKRGTSSSRRTSRAPAILTRMRRDLGEYRSRHADLLAKAGGRFVLIEDGEVVGAFDSADEALARAGGRNGCLVAKVTGALPPEHWIYVTAATASRG